MDVSCSKISENYTKNSYTTTPNDEKFVSILQPVLAMIQHKLKGNYLYAEEYFVKFLQEKKRNVETEDILDLSRHMSACSAHLYIILVSMILSFSLGFPLAFCLKTCYKKASNPNKYKYWFFTQSVLFTGAIGFLLIGSATSLNIGMHSQKFMERFPREYSNAIRTLNQTKLHFNANCKKLHSTVDSNLMEILNLTSDVLDNIANMLDDKTASEYLLSLKKFNNSLNNMEEVFDSIGFMATGQKPTSRLVSIIDQLHYETYSISRQLSAIFLNMNDEIVSEERMMPDIIFPRNYVYPDWEELYYDVEVILGVLFPNMNSTIRLVDILKRNFNNVHGRNMDNIRRQVQRIQEFIRSKCGTISEAIELFTTNRIENAGHKIGFEVDQVTYSTSPRNSWTDFLKLRTWVFLFPSMYGFIVFFFFTIGFVGACREIYTTSNGKIATGTNTIIFFKLAIRISITFLWLILLITSVLYLIHIPAVVVCGTIKKDKLIDRYLDKPYWKNETWLTSKLNKYFPHSRKPITVKNLLVECGKNKTIIRSLNLEEHIIKYNKSTLEQVVQEAKVKYADVIRKQSSPKFNDVLHYINLIVHRMNINFITEIQNNLNKTESGIVLLQERLSLLNVSQKFFFEYDLSYIRPMIKEIKAYLEDFLRARHLIPVVKKEILELEEINHRLHNITTNDLYVDIDVYLNNVTEYVKCLHEKNEVFIKHSLLHEIGNCSFLPYIYDKFKYLVCDYGLEIVNSLWLSLAILSFSIIVAAILACRIAAYVRGSYKIHGRYLLESSRYSDRQPAAINPTGKVLEYPKGISKENMN